MPAEYNPPAPLSVAVHPGDDYAAMLALSRVPSDLIPHLVALREWANRDGHGVCVVYSVFTPEGSIRVGSTSSGRICVHGAAAVLDTYALNLPHDSCEGR